MTSRKCEQCKRYIVASAGKGKIYGCARSKCVFEPKEPTTKENLCSDCMDFPNTFDEFADYYGFKDTEEVYTNGNELIQVFRVKQWLEHISTTKNNLGVDCISRADARSLILPSVTPQEPRWIPVSEKKPNKGGEYLLWGKIDESEEEEYCFVGDYYEFEEKFGTEISNYDPKTLGFIDTEIEEYYSVVAWMPLPTSYQGEK